MNSVRVKEQIQIELWSRVPRRVSTPVWENIRKWVEKGIIERTHDQADQTEGDQTSAAIWWRVQDQAAEDYDGQRPGSRSDF